jgi:hypothetical protein
MGNSDKNDDNLHLIYKEFSYRLVGGLHYVHNTIGSVPREESHQDAYSRWLREQNIPHVAKPKTRREIIFNSLEAFSSL